MTTLIKKPLNRYLLWGAALLILLGCAIYLQAAAEPSNPRADFWRLVRNGVPGYTSVSSEGHAVLIQNGGENWRELRNLVIINITPWVIGLALVAMGVFHLVVGGDKLKEPRTGEMIERYRGWEIALHWYTAVLFIILAITGLSILLGRGQLIALFGHEGFAAYLAVAKVIHNWSGPLFLAGVFLQAVVWFRDNIPRKRDLLWFKNMGGMIGNGPRPPTGKINAGEKCWFWLMIISSIAVGITGFLLYFPIWGQDRLVMQVSNVIHGVAGVLFVTASFGHIYMGSVGAEGAFESMLHGKVDIAWAKHHSDLWLEEKRKEE